MHITEIKKLPIEQRMLLMEQRDTLCYEDEEIKSPSWHEELLNDRMQLINSGKASSRVKR